MYACFDANPLCYACSKGDALRLLRKLVVLGVLVEETFRQDNEYGAVGSYLRVSEAAARQLSAGNLRVVMPFVGAAAKPRIEKAPNRKRSMPAESLAPVGAWEDDDDMDAVEVIEDMALEMRGLSAVGPYGASGEAGYKPDSPLSSSNEVLEGLAGRLLPLLADRNSVAFHTTVVPEWCAFIPAWKQW
jgi:hypothetical protein